MANEIRDNESVFDGNLLGMIGIGILSFIIVLFTLGIGTPWAVVMRQRWMAKHTVIEGKRLAFTGSGAALFGKYIIWMLLTIVTLGIYSFWLNLRMIQWVTKHTVFEGTN